MASDSSLLIRRSAEFISARLRYREQSQVVGLLGTLLVILTIAVFGLAIFWVDYTCNHVIATLAAVENSRPSTYLPLDGDGLNNSCDPTDLEATAPASTKPITGGLRSAIKYLHARGGIWYCFRGFRMYLALTVGGIGVGFLVPATIRISVHFSIRVFFGQFVASMIFATWHMAWVHLVIADKSPRNSYRRMLGLKHWSRIAPAAALYNILMSATFSLPIAARSLVGWTVIGVVASRGIEGLLNFLISILPSLFFLLASVPARAIFIRVAASMLPEEDEPIVPLDRAFCGKMAPDRVVRSSKLGLKDAWTTFERTARTRYFKITLKALAIEVALGFVGIFLVIGEMFLVTSSS